MDEILDHQISKLKELETVGVGLFFLYCAERLYPLYKQFSEDSNWGDVVFLRTLLDTLWGGEWLTIREDKKWDEDKLNAQIPHADDFDNVSATYAQDFCICLDAAIMAITNSPNIELIEYVFEPIKIAVSIQEYGELEVGTEYEDEFDLKLSNSQLLKYEISSQNDAITLLSNSSVNSGILSTLNSLAVERAWSYSKLS